MTDAMTPWYRQFWPWFLFGLPGIVVVAGLSTWYIAETGADHLVADDYYKEGLAINRELVKQKRARELGISATVAVERGYIRAEMSGDVQAPALLLVMSHPMDSAQDFELKLAQRRTGVYEAPWPATPSQRWIWQLESIAADQEKTWRVDGDLAVLPADEH